MNYDYNKKINVNYTYTDANLNLSLIGSVALIQEFMTEFFDKIGSTNIKLQKENDALWVVSKTKVKFFKIPVWNEDIDTKGYIIKHRSVRIETENAYRYINGDLAFVVNQELCVIDINSRKLRSIDSDIFPDDIELKESVVNTGYLKLNDDFSEDDFYYEQEAFLPDIDNSKHVNNIAYIRYILNTLSSDFYDKIKLKDFEIHYINEAKEKQKLKIYKKQFDDEIRFLIKESDREIIRASLRYEML